MSRLRPQPPGYRHRGDLEPAVSGGIECAVSRQFDILFETWGIQINRTVPMSPNLRAHVERFLQTLKFECLNKFVIVAEKHLDHICGIWSRHYNEERPHSSRDHLPTDFTVPPEEATTVRVRDMVCTSKLGSVIHSYSRRAA